MMRSNKSDQYGKYPNRSFSSVFFIVTRKVFSKVLSYNSLFFGSQHRIFINRQGTKNILT